MKKFVLFVLLLIIVLPVSVLATGGGLRKNSIKTCPDGVTYGMHSDGKGGTHWHVAATNGENYYASGEALASDPCPGYTQNSGTAKSTNSSTSTSTGSQSVPAANTQPTNVVPAVTNTVSDNTQSVVSQASDSTVSETEVAADNSAPVATEVVDKAVTDKESSDTTTGESSSEDTLDLIIGSGALATIAGGSYAVVKSIIKKRQ